MLSTVPPTIHIPRFGDTPLDVAEDVELAMV
jgi:hypothetical protein